MVAQHYTDISTHEVNTTILQQTIEVASQSSSVRTEKYALERANNGKPVSAIFATDEVSRLPQIFFPLCYVGWRLSGLDLTPSPCDTQDVKKSLKEVNKAFAEATGINHYVF